MHSRIFFLLKANFWCFRNLQIVRNKIAILAIFFWPCVYFENKNILALKITKIWISKDQIIYISLFCIFLLYISLLFIVLKNVRIPKFISKSLGHVTWYVLILRTWNFLNFWSVKCKNFMVFDSENSKCLEFCFGNCVVFWTEKICYYIA